MTAASTSTSQAMLRQAALRAWTPALLAIAALAVVFGAAFWEQVVRAVEVWLGSRTYNHCFLVLPMAAFLLWQRRTALVGLRPRPLNWVLVLLIPLALVWVASAALEILEGQQLVMITMFEVALVAILGWRTFRALLAPLLFLYFLVPFGGFLVHPLQVVTADMSVFGLQHSGVPVFADGFRIEIPEGTFEIAEACAGMRFLIASLVFGCFYATIVYRSWIRRVIFIALSVIVPIIANGIRAYGTIMLGHLEGSASAVEADHIIYGWVFFSLVTLALIAIGMTFADTHPGDMPAPVAPAAGAGSRLRIAAVAGIAALVVVIGPAFITAFGAAHATPLPPLPPLHGTAWVRENAGPPWLPVIFGAVRESAETYRGAGGQRVSRYTALYRLGIGSRSKFTTTVNQLTSDPPTNDKSWRVEKRGTATVAVAGVPVTVATAQIIRPGGRRIVWSFYQVGDRVAPGLLGAKLMQAQAMLLGGPRIGSFVAISTAWNGNDAGAAAALGDFLQSLGPLHRGGL